MEERKRLQGSRGGRGSRGKDPFFFLPCLPCPSSQFMEGRQMKETPTIELFAIGTELVLGRIQDTNSYWLAQQISQLGGYLKRITMLTDDKEDIIKALSDAIKRGTDIILTTGGLGPTPDDLTVECVAQLLGVSTFAHEPTIENYMVRRNLTSREQVTPAMIKMATVPQNSEVLQNPVGWAPCIKCQKDQAMIIIMPGPPKEMEGVFTQHLAPILSQIYTDKVATLRVSVSMFESEVSPILQKVMQKYPRVYLKAYVAMRQEDGLPVDMVSNGSNHEEAEQNLKAALEYLKELVTEKGKKVYI